MNVSVVKVMCSNDHVMPTDPIEEEKLPVKHSINLMWPYVGTNFVIIRSCIRVHS